MEYAEAAKEAREVREIVAASGLAMRLLETKRLLLRPLQVRDADDLQAISGSEAVALKTGSIPYPYPSNGARDFILQSIAIGHTINRFGIFLKEYDRLIGATACGKAATPSELTYMIHPQYWGQGYATEAAGAVVRLCFEEFDRSVIHSSAMADNVASIRVLKKLGFVETLRKPIFLPNRGRKADTSFQQLTRDGWTALALNSQTDH